MCEYGSVWLLAGCCAAEFVAIKLKSKHAQKRRHPIFQAFICLRSVQLRRAAPEPPLGLRPRDR